MFTSRIQNPTDDVRVEVLAAEKLFYEENMFKLVVYVETGCFALFVVGGIIWEFFVRNSPTGIIDRPSFIFLEHSGR